LEVLPKVICPNSFVHLWQFSILLTEDCISYCQRSAFQLHKNKNQSLYCKQCCSTENNFHIHFTLKFLYIFLNSKKLLHLNEFSTEHNKYLERHIKIPVSNNTSYLYHLHLLVKKSHDVFGLYSSSNLPVLVSTITAAMPCLSQGRIVGGLVGVKGRHWWVVRWSWG
jgi:hypothetical protein